MSKPSTDSPGPAPPGGEELSAESQELLARVRRSRNSQSAPDSLRQRALARALAEAARPAVLAMPASALVPVARPSTRVALRTLAAAALGVGLILGAPSLFRSLSARFAPSPERGAAGNWAVSGPAGELLKPSSPLFRLPLLPLTEPLPEPSAPGAQPFSPQERTWQVRRWNDPKSPPDTPAAYSFDQGALCVTLGTGDRVLGGWPWPSEGSVAPARVKLTGGRPYRLSFKAWVKGSLPSQVLLGVGHREVPFVAAAAARVQVSAAAEPFALDFVAAQDDADVGVAFLAANGHQAAPTRVCIGEMRLSER
jgi:hypothetical protein